MRRTSCRTHLCAIALAICSTACGVAGDSAAGTTSTSTTEPPLAAAAGESDSAPDQPAGDSSTGADATGGAATEAPGTRSGTGAPARTMSLFIDADVTWSDATGCTITDTTMHVRIDLDFFDNGLIEGISDESSMGHTPVTRCGANQMGDWTTIEAPVVTVLPSYWDRAGIHLRLDWSDVTEIAISTGPVQQAATVAVARGSLCTDWPGNLFVFLIPSDWSTVDPAHCEFVSDNNHGDVFLAVTQVDDDEVWRSIPEFLEHLTFPTDAEYEAILEARAAAENELGNP